MIRNRFGRAVLLVAAGGLLLLLAVGAANPEGRRETRIPVSGTPVPELASFDRVVLGLMAKWKIPGGSVAVVKDERLVLAHGYGWADRENRQPVTPDSLFRIASLSKSLTAAAILKLVEDGRLRLDDRAFDRLNDLKPRTGATMNPDLRKITIRNLLQHSGGWDRDKSFDPMFRSREIAAAMGVPPPAGAETIIRYMLDQPLQFSPGTSYAYSNFGYCVLGRIIEKVTGERYEDFVRNRILRPAGVQSMRLGHTRLVERAPGEVRYYGFPGMGLAPSVFPSGPAKVPWPYGGFYAEAMDSHGGWLAAATDLARFIDAVDGRRNHPQVLNPQSIAQMIARPAPPLWVGTDSWYGMGWSVRTAEGGTNWWHTGSLPGTTTLMVRAGIGVTWVVLLNSRPKDDGDLGRELDDGMWQAEKEVERWPAHDLF
ncbi:MAG TPA: serine hydrolase domain-containing protein [Thermoanaerobaculia bacterium]|jgi:N-acyl-D-amino-acid deacylase